MRYILAGLLLLTGSCRTITSCFISTETSPEREKHDTKLSRTDAFQAEIDRLLAEDADNKKWERIYIKEIKAAQKHQDRDAYRFFLSEYLKIPRFILPEWLKKEPGFVPGVTLKELENL